MEDSLSKASRFPRTTILIAFAVFATLSSSRSAQADFFDGARKTFQTDIPHFFTQDFPHFFQDDIPCAFGGHPTSGARKDCASNGSTDGKTAPPKEAPPKKGDPSKDPSSSGE
jgi:hypothetical protein